MGPFDDGPKNQQSNAAYWLAYDFWNKHQQRALEVKNEDHRVFVLTDDSDRKDITEVRQFINADPPLAQLQTDRNALDAKLTSLNVEISALKAKKEQLQVERKQKGYQMALRHQKLVGTYIRDNQKRIVEFPYGPEYKPPKRSLKEWLTRWFQ